MQNLRISLVQGATRWLDPAGNRDYYGHLIAPLRGLTDLVVLPETFTSGFSNEAIDNAETMDGPTVAWMREQAATLGAAVTGSVQLREGEARTRGIQPPAVRHARRRTADLRQAPPVPLCEGARALRRRSRPPDRGVEGLADLPAGLLRPALPGVLAQPIRRRAQGRLDYDLLLYVANWPSARAYPWKTLLRARAIENLCYVAGLNRVGTDGNGLHYAGDSAVIDFLGHPVSECTDEEVVVTTTLQAAELLAHRERFPAMLDGDAFELK